MTAHSVFVVVGGQRFFDALVERFYARVETDAVLRPLYPDDLTPGKRGLAMFLGQYWGGPPEYSAEKGHPRLRMRHAGFRITERERDAWIGHMFAALDDVEPALAPEIVQALRDYFDHAATWMINQAG